MNNPKRLKDNQRVLEMIMLLTGERLKLQSPLSHESSMLCSDIEDIEATDL